VRLTVRPSGVFLALLQGPAIGVYEPRGFKIQDIAIQADAGVI
jgi:hypothetical protein